MGTWQGRAAQQVAAETRPLRAALRTSNSPEHDEPHAAVTAADLHAAHIKAARRRTVYVRLVGLGVMGLLLLLTLLTVGRKEALWRLVTWIDQHQVAGAAIFFGIYIWFTVLFLPAAVLSLAAGALFGMWLGLLFVWVAAIVGESLSFLLGRFLLRHWVQELTENWPSWHAMEAALAEDGWKLVALLRVSPVMPFSIINYALGTTSLPFQQYFWPSVFGIVPGIIIYVYLGSLARDLSEVVQKGGISHHHGRAAQIAFMVFGGVSAIIVIVLSAIYTKRAIARRLASVCLEGSETLEQQALLDVEAGGEQQQADGPLRQQSAGADPRQQSAGADLRQHQGADLRQHHRAASQETVAVRERPLVALGRGSASAPVLQSARPSGAALQRKGS